MHVYKSRFTPNLENGENVKFNRGEVVRYKMRSGEEIDITIDSELMQNGEYLGYESIFHDDGKRYFAVSKGIISWKDKQ